MKIFAIGDVQGCRETLDALLGRLGPWDRLWFVGDLVNRGPDSLGVLRRVRALGDRAVCVLGNHDLHLLERAWGVAKAKAGDTLDAVLAAPDAGELLAWLAARPLVHRDDHGVMVHAGLLPGWTVPAAERLARRSEQRLQLRDASVFDDEAVRALTRLRACDTRGEPRWSFKDHPSRAPRGLVPWFRVPGRKSAGTHVVFGHWAALGLEIGPDFAAIDTGCVWGGALTAFALHDHSIVQEKSREA